MARNQRANKGAMTVQQSDAARRTSPEPAGPAERDHHGGGPRDRADRYPAEIEQVLFTHPGVRDVAVLGVADGTWGEIVAAVVVPSDPRQAPRASELHGFCRAKLAPHKTPVRWFGAAELPLTGSGKIQKFRLRELIAEASLTELA